MIERKHIAAIKAAQNDAGLDDNKYRNILKRVAGVSSCKDLTPNMVSAVVKTIRAAGGKREGWKSAQIRKFKQYAKYAKMKPNDYRRFLYEETGQMHEEAPGLTQAQFDEIMPAIEEKLEYRIMNGEASRPTSVNMTYWRDRRPQMGKINTREQNKIIELWNELKRASPATQLRFRLRRPAFSTLDPDQRKRWT